MNTPLIKPVTPSLPDDQIMIIGPVLVCLGEFKSALAPLPRPRRAVIWFAWLKMLAHLHANPQNVNAN
jgi:hypothetical protein